MSLSVEIAEMTKRLETRENVPDVNEVYTMLLRAMLEIRTLEHTVRVLEDRLLLKD